MWIKICGMTTAAAVDAALQAHADAIGFVFAPSVRRLTPTQAAQLVAGARGRLQCIAVTQHPSQELLDEILAVFRPDTLQTDAADLQTLRLPDSLDLLPVMRAGTSPARRLPLRMLFEGPASGSGVQCDWTDARVLVRRTQLVLAGGLNAANVAAAIADVEPFGVDVSSGVEDQPGLKSVEKIMRFVQAARAAFGRVASARAPGEEMRR